MGNEYNVLTVEESPEIVITSENQLRNRMKSLRKKEEKYTESPSKELLSSIHKLKVAIREYNDNKITPTRRKKKSRKKGKKKSNKCLLRDDDYFLNAEFKKIKLTQMKKEIKEKRINNLWKRSSNLPPLFEMKKYMLYPKSLLNTVVSLLCYNNQEDNLFSLLPKDILIYLLEENITYVDFKITDNELHTARPPIIRWALGPTSRKQRLLLRPSKFWLEFI